MQNSKSFQTDKIPAATQMPPAVLCPLFDENILQLTEGKSEDWRASEGDPSDETWPEQHVHFPLSLADWGPRNSLL